MTWNTHPTIRSDAAIRIGYHLIIGLCKTYRYESNGEHQWLSHYRQGGCILFCSWHQQFFPIMHYFRRYRLPPMPLMISLSRDGDIAAGVAALGGWKPIRGSSSRGARAGFRHLVTELRHVRVGGHIVDGPQGPAGVVKPGVIALARSAGAMIVPIYISADRAWMMQSWDRFLIPQPFARVQVEFGNPVDVAKTPKSEWEELRGSLEADMRRHLIEVSPGKVKKKERD